MLLPACDRITDARPEIPAPGDERLSSRVAELLRERKIDGMIDTKLGKDYISDL